MPRKRVPIAERRYADFPNVMNLKQTMTLLRVSYVTLYGLLKSEEIRCKRVGRRYLIPKKSIISYVEGGERELAPDEEYGVQNFTTRSTG